MPVRIPKDLPARKFLENENIFVMTYERAESQDIRPLRIAVLNLMPNKIATETQLLRLMGNTPLQVDVQFLTTSSYTATHTSEEHLTSFYKTFDEVVKEGVKYDGMIITGAPVEKLDFTDVKYWNELSRIMDWASRNVYSSMFICWAAQAAMYHYYGIDKRPLNKKAFGVFRHDVFNRTNPLVRGFDDEFFAPHSRYTEVKREDILACDMLTLLADSAEAGAYLVSSKDLRRVFVFGHGEYDANTLDSEYRRDIDKGIEIDIPENYYEQNDPSGRIKMRWKAHEALLISNWLNYCVYQATPFDIDSIE